MMSIDKYQVDLDLLTANSEGNGSSKAKMHLGVTDINGVTDNNNIASINTKEHLIRYKSGNEGT